MKKVFALPVRLFQEDDTKELNINSKCFHMMEDPVCFLV